ncbi:MAG: purine-nucleoside phosphorylase [Planctomycetota bacterium]|jgi:purine-nucleoside phosphorylase
MGELKVKIEEAAGKIREKLNCSPDVGIILGTGLGDLARKLEDPKEIEYEEIPHFPKSTVQGHAGQFISGKLSGKNVVVMEGRFHYYEGYTLEQVTFPVRVMKALGIKTLIVTCACGGMNPMHQQGDILIIDDHINLLGDNPLIGPNDESLGPRFPDMYCPYDPHLVAAAEKVAMEESIRVQKGVYVIVSGPCLETKAEYRFLRNIGADAVGMSTVPEVIVAVHAGLKVMGLGVLTDMCLPDALKPVDIDEIIEVANNSGPKLEKIVSGVIAEIRD